MGTLGASPRAVYRAGALSGIATAVLFAAGNAVGVDQPDPGAHGAELVEFYADAPDLIVVGGSMSFLSVALLAFFASGLRRALAQALPPRAEHPGAHLP